MTFDNDKRKDVDRGRCCMRNQIFYVISTSYDTNFETWEPFDSDDSKTVSFSFAIDFTTYEAMNSSLFLN